MLYLVSGVLATLICWPLLGGSLLYRDAVGVPDFSLTAAALGIDGTAPRAVPQDAALAVASRIVDGGWLVGILTLLAVAGAGIGYGTLARHLVPAAGTSGAVVAAAIGIWNPFVAERLLQGQWSLLLGYAALGPIVLVTLRAALRRQPRDLLVLAGLFALAGFTPTGSVLALIVAATAAVATKPSLRSMVLGGIAWLGTASPWLVGAAVSTSASSSGGAAAFALRAEPGLGSLGTALGLGGIWNADAVPASRTWWWAAVATGLFLVVVGVGCAELIRRPTARSIAALAWLAGGTIVLAVLAATGPGLAVLDAALRYIPGAGLFRDTQKYLALVVPFAAVAGAAATAALRRWVPGGFAAAILLAAVVAPLPDLGLGVGGKLTAVHIPADYQQVKAAIGDDPDGTHGSVALWPMESVRALTWTDGPSLSALPRMINAPVVVAGSLIVDEETVDAPSGRTREIADVLSAGGDRRQLAALGVGWVIVEEGTAPAQLAAHATEVVSGEHLRLFRIDAAVPAPTPSTAARIAATSAMLLWFFALICGALVAVSGQRRSAKTASKPSVVNDQE